MLCRELRLQLKSFLVWTILLICVFAGVVYAYPWIITGTMVETIDLLLSSFSPQILRAFNLDIASIAKASGWFITEGLTLYLIAVSIYAATTGAGALSKERTENTMESLWSLPVSRVQIAASHYAPGLLYVCLQNALVAAAVGLALWLQDDFTGQTMVPLLIAPALAAVPIYSMSFFVGSLCSRAGTARSISLAFVLLSYCCHVVGRMSEKVEALGRFSLFALCDARLILLRRGLVWQQIAIALALTVLPFLVSVWVTDRRSAL